MIIPLLKQLYHFLLPSFCVLCDQCVRTETLCQNCYSELPWQKNSCIQCAQPLQTECHTPQRCGQCLQTSPPYDRTVCLFNYQPPLDHFILSLKFREKLSFAKLLGNLLSEKLESFYAFENKPEWIIPVPLHSTRLKERGYNQALEIARPVSKKLNIAIEKTHCIRTIPTLPQASATFTERKKNIKNAFYIDTSFKADHVAILDDVFTTGNTVSELSRMLRKAGVKQIDIWCCARTFLNSKKT